MTLNPSGLRLFLARVAGRSGLSLQAAELDIACELGCGVIDGMDPDDVSFEAIAAACSSRPELTRLANAICWLTPSERTQALTGMMH